MASKKDADAEIQRERIEPENFLGAHRRVEEANVRVEDGKHLKAAAMASAKSLGVDGEAYKLALFLKKKGPERAEQILRRALFYCEWQEIPIGIGLDLFRTQDMPRPRQEAATEHSAWEAQMAGRKLGLAGAPIEDIDGRYQPGSEAHQAAIKGWHNGQAVLAEGLAPRADPQEEIIGGDDLSSEEVQRRWYDAGYAAAMRGEGMASCHFENDAVRDWWLSGYAVGVSTRNNEAPEAG